LLVHEIHDSRVRLFLLKWIAALVSLLGVAICGFNLMPIILVLGLFSATISLCALVFWLGSQDLFLKFVLEDEGFYNLATQSRALSVFDETDSDQPQPRKSPCLENCAAPRNFESALTLKNA
jgi:hypothetical protein